MHNVVIRLTLLLTEGKNCRAAICPPLVSKLGTYGLVQLFVVRQFMGVGTRVAMAL